MKNNCTLLYLCKSHPCIVWPIILQAYKSVTLRQPLKCESEKIFHPTPCLKVAWKLYLLPMFFLSTSIISQAAVSTSTIYILAIKLDGFWLKKIPLDLIKRADKYSCQKLAVFSYPLLRVSTQQVPFGQALRMSERKTLKWNRVSGGFPKTGYYKCNKVPSCAADLTSCLGWSCVSQRVKLEKASAIFKLISVFPGDLVQERTFIST